MFIGVFFLFLLPGVFPPNGLDDILGPVAGHVPDTEGAAVVNI